MPKTIAEAVAALGHELPAAPTPAANYVPYVQAGNLLFISGQISQDRNGPAWLGHLGDTVSLEDGQKAAQACALAILAQVSAATGGDLARIRRVVKLGVFVASAPGFTQQPQVGNGASDLIAAVFGDKGKHARAAVGVAALPRGVSVEVEAVVELED
ncbi:MAG: RidA family protein [Inquilinus limosus]|uniref:RidA family protein n=1 Tax=Inquilinus limosus TaxID=171674 RepID=A0A952FMU6_9PROT|nr:RidA family protein [Inquilinus limosus]